MSNDGSGLVLAGLKVIDFSRLLPGPWAAQMLGDLGAEVTKIEALDSGDPSRHNPPDFQTTSVYFHSVNGNKRGLGLDIRHPDGKRIADRLLADADVVIESFRPDVARRLGIDYPSVQPVNPRVVYASFSGYGQTGPLAGVPGHDLVIQAMSGHMGAPNHRAGDAKIPEVPTFQAADYAGASMGTIGLLAAIMKQRATGVGSYLDISLFDSLVYMSKVAHTESLARRAGKTVDQRIEVYGGNPRYATYATGDGKAIAVSFLEARVWAHFCRHIDRPDLIDASEGPDARHTTHGERATLYRGVIADYCRARTRDELCAELEAAQIPICPIYSPDEALDSPQATARGLVWDVAHPTEGSIPLLANPLGRSGLVREQRTPSPSRIGGDSEAILRELGFDSSDYERLRKDGVVA
ncbi:MAG: CaiB/BaiF CoA-transferase family protein [Pseudomonadota bacterium]